MGLISEYVEVGLIGTNIKYFESLGYYIPRKENKNGKLSVSKSTKITVKVKDLRPNSSVKIDVECDCCKKSLTMAYSTYNNHCHNGNYYCRSCANKLLHSGKNNPNWNPNKTDEEREKKRNYPEYIDFIKKVLARDNYICQCCGKKSEQDVEVHHLDGYSWCRERRTDVTNGITLCKNCHGNFHSIYGKGQNTKEQFEEWVGYAINVCEYDGELPTTRKVVCLETKEVFDSAKECSEKMNLDMYSIYQACSRSKSHYLHSFHFCWNDEFKKLSEDEISNIINADHRGWITKVVCLNTREIFPSIQDAIRKYPKATSTGIINTCQGKNRYSGIDNEQNRLVWCYYDDYIKLTDIEINNKLQYSIGHKSSKKVICVTTGEIFASITIASKKYDIFVNNIILCCQNKIKSTGRFKKNIRLEWMYYEDFLKLPIEEQNEILSRNKDYESSNDGSFLLDKEAM